MDNVFRGPQLPGCRDHSDGSFTTVVEGLPRPVLSLVVLLSYCRIGHLLTGAIARRRALWPLRFEPLPFPTAEVASVDDLVVRVSRPSPACLFLTVSAGVRVLGGGGSEWVDKNLKIQKKLKTSFWTKKKRLWVPGKVCCHHLLTSASALC